MTDACFVYRRQVIRQTDSHAMILRGREIAREAANAPLLPSSMQNYSDDQIRELYGEVEQKRRRSHEDQRIFHTPMIDAWNEQPLWKLSSSSSNLGHCPVPKFRLDKNDQTLLMATCFSTGLSNRPVVSTCNEKDIVRGSFRTSVGERTSVSPSPLLLNVCFDLNKLNSAAMDKTVSADPTSDVNTYEQQLAALTDQVNWRSRGLSIDSEASSRILDRFTIAHV